MARKAIKLSYDVDRLVALAKNRDRHRAVMRDLSERYQELRQRRIDIERRAEQARENAQGYSGGNSRIAIETAEKLKARSEEVRAQMADLQAEIEAAKSEAAEAGRLLSACLAFAQSEKLAIPPALHGEVAQ